MSFFFFFRPVFLPDQIDTGWPRALQKKRKKKKRKTYEIVTQGGRKIAYEAGAKFDGFAKEILADFHEEDDEEIIQLMILMEDL